MNGSEKRFVKSWLLYGNPHTHTHTQSHTHTHTHTHKCIPITKYYCNIQVLSQFPTCHTPSHHYIHLYSLSCSGRDQMIMTTVKPVSLVLLSPIQTGQMFPRCRPSVFVTAHCTILQLCFDHTNLRSCFVLQVKF